VKRSKARTGVHIFDRMATHSPRAGGRYQDIYRVDQAPAWANTQPYIFARSPLGVGSFLGIFMIPHRSRGLLFTRGWGNHPVWKVLLRMLDLTFPLLFIAIGEGNPSKNMRLTIDHGLRYRGVQPVSVDRQYGGTCRATGPTIRCVGMKVPLVLSHGIGDMLFFSSSAWA